MKASSEKQSMTFFLPSLGTTSPPFQEFVYQQNKFIVYTEENSKKRSPSNLSSSKISAFPSRPMTTATLNHRSSPKNQPSRNRNQQSIEKFIKTHQKLNSLRYYQSKNQLKKIKAFKIKNHQSLTQNNFKIKDKLNFTEILKIQDSQFERKDIHEKVNVRQDSLFPDQLLKAEEKMIKSIKKQQNLISEENKNQKLIRNVKSLNKLNTERSLVDNKRSTMQPLSCDRQKNTIEIKARNYFPLRKSLSMTPNQTSRFLKNSKVSNYFAQPKNATEKEQKVKKQPEIKQQKSSIHQQESQKITVQEEHLNKQQNVLNQKKAIDQSIEYLLNPKFIDEIFERYNNRSNLYSRTEEDTQIKVSPQYKESLYIAQKQILDNDKTLKHEKKKDFIESIVQENMKEMEQKLLEQEIFEINQQLTKIINKSQISQSVNGSKISNSLQKTSKIDEKSTSPSNFFKVKDKKSKKTVLKTNKNENFIELDTDNLKRALIIDFLDQKYYKKIKNLYWKVVNQQKNAFISDFLNYQSTNNNQPKSYFSSRIPKENNNNNLVNLKTNESTFQSNQPIFVDYQFPHQSIKISSQFQPVSWLYFSPGQNSSLFPKKLKLPQNYVQKSTKKQFSLINLLNCLLTVNPKLIERLIEPAYNNIFSVWLNINGVFEPIFVDGYLPYDSRLNSLYGHTEQFLWIGILIKATAKIFGGYQELQRLSFRQWSKVILGFQLEVLNKPSYQEIKNWKDQQFQEKIQEYFKKAQSKHQSNLIIHQKQSNNLSIIKSIKNNRIRFTDCNSPLKKHEISLFELIIDKNYEILLIPQSKQIYHCNGEFQSFNQGNIVSYQLKVSQDKSWVKMSINYQNKSISQQESQRKMEIVDNLRRRILIYEIPLNFKKHNKKEMTLKHVIGNNQKLKLSKLNSSTFLKNQPWQFHLPQLKKGHYKIFIQCGKISLNDYFESHQRNINKWLKTQQSFVDDKTNPFTKKQTTTGKIQNRTFKNTISLASNNKIELKGGQSLIINTLTGVNEMIEDKNYRYFSPKIKNSKNKDKNSFEYD